jgi:dihydroneopterin aldolase
VACTTDQLSDTYCYDTLVNTIKTSVATRNFRLLEHLGREIHQTVKNSLASDIKVSIRITKKPAILNLTGGVTFCYSDEE